jgi:hypothetical protein
MVMDETLYQVQAKVQNFAVIYLGEFEVCLQVKGLCDGGVEMGWIGAAICEDEWTGGLLDVLIGTVTDELSIVDITKVPDFNKVSLFLPIAFRPRSANPEIGNDRCTNCTIHVPSCSSTGKSPSLPFSPLALAGSLTMDGFGRNKHIMIDLGTGNNNKMYVLFSLALSIPNPRLIAQITVTGQSAINKKYVFIPLTIRKTPLMTLTDDRYHRDGISWSIERPRSRCCAKR